MTDANWIDIYYGAQVMGTTAFALYLSVVSGFLVVAYTVGANLTKGQTLFLCVLFVVFATFTMWGIGTYWTQGYIAEGAMAGKITFNPIGINPTVIAIPMATLGQIGCLVFMANVRKRARLAADDVVSSDFR